MSNAKQMLKGSDSGVVNAEKLREKYLRNFEEYKTKREQAEKNVVMRTFEQCKKERM